MLGTKQVHDCFYYYDCYILRHGLHSHEHPTAVWLRPFTIHLKLPHCLSAMPQYKIKIFLKIPYCWPLSWCHPTYQSVSILSSIVSAHQAHQCHKTKRRSSSVSLSSEEAKITEEKIKAKEENEPPHKDKGYLVLRTPAASPLCQ